MKIYVLTPIYATTTSSQGSTPVVHYFAREWVKMGHDVTVFHLVARYPRPYYWLGRLFQHKLNSRLGILVPIECPKDVFFQAEGVSVHRLCLRKLRPHSLYSKKEIRRAFVFISKYCDSSGTPDWFAGHWDNPQMELLTSLKQRFGKPISVVFHNNYFDFMDKYGEAGIRMLRQMDAIGFRSRVGQDNFFAKFGKPQRAFMAFSGVSEAFLEAGNQKVISGVPHHYVYVGSLIARKHPAAILTALSIAYPDGDFTLTYIGDGAEKLVIEEEYQRLGCPGKICFTGRIPREQIISYLMQAEVFVMISKGEIFGLVYLEAMALGLIPIGSRGEGIDGIIHDRENGFLCEAGNFRELSEIMCCLKHLAQDDLIELSENARKTALEYSDSAVARKYVDNLCIPKNP